jgi:hypothetical protein
MGIECEPAKMPRTSEDGSVAASADGICARRAEALALQCIQEAARAQDQHAVTYWSRVLVVIQKLRRDRPAEGKEVIAQQKPIESRKARLN